MRIMAQQPHYFPELYLWNRMLNVDKIVILDAIQVNLRSPQRKTPIKIPGKQDKHWLTIPISHKHSKFAQIGRVQIADGEDWRKSHVDTLTRAYRKADFFDLGGEIFDRICIPFHFLMSVNLETLFEITKQFWIPNDRFVFLSRLDIDTTVIRKSDLMLEICKKLNAIEYMCGKVSVVGNDEEEPYLNLDDFRNAGIQIVAQNWTCREYKQVGKGAFIPNLSIIDLILNMGYVEAFEILKEEQVEYL